MAEFDLGRAQGEILISTDQAKRSVDGLTGSVTKSMQQAGKSIARVGTRLSLGVTLPLVGIGVQAVKTSMEFTKTMNTMAAVAGVPAPQLEKLRDLSIQLGQDTVFSANEAGEAMLELSKAGVATSDIMGGALANTLDLATAGDLGLADAATIASNAMNTFGLSGKESKIAVDALAGAANASSADVSTLAQSLTQGGNAAALAGLSIQDASGFLGALADQGIRGSDAGTSLKTFLLSLVPTSTRAKEAIRKLNLDFIDQEGNIRNITDIAEELHDNLGGLTQAQQQMALKTIFGTDAFRAGAIAMKLGSGGLEEYMKATNKVGSASEVAQGKLEGLPGVIEALKGSIDTALLAIGDVLAPVVQKVATVLADLINAFVGLPQPVKVAIVLIAGLAAAAGPLLFIFGNAIALFSTLGSVILGPVGLIIAAIALLIAAFIKMNGGIEGAIKAVTGFFDELKQKLQPAFDAFKDIIDGVSDAFGPLIDAFDDISKSAEGKGAGAIDLIAGAINNFAKALAVIVPAAARGFVAVVLWLIKNVPKAWKAISDGVSGVMDSLQPLFDFIGKQFLQIWQALVEVWNDDLKPAMADLEGLWKDLVSIFQELWPILRIIGGAFLATLVIPFLVLIKVLPIAIKIIGFLIKVLVQVIRTVVAVAKAIIQFAVNAVGAIIRFAKSVGRWVMEMVRFISRIPENVRQFFIDIYNAAFEWTMKVINFVTDKWNGIINFFKGLGSKLANAGKNMWNWIVNGAKAVANTAIGIINGIIDRINKFQIHIHVDPPGPLPSVDFDWNGPGIPHIPSFAAGGKNFAGGLALVGEQGPEIIALPRGTNILSNRIVRSLERKPMNRGHTRHTIGQQQRDLRGVQVVGTVNTPFGPAEIRGMIRDEIDEHDNFNKGLVRMGRTDRDD